MKAPILVLVALPFLWLANRLFKLWRNYTAAKRTGLPVLILPFTITSPAWIFGKKYIEAICNHLPPYFSAWTQRIENWTQKAKFRPYHEMDTRAYWIVSHKEKELLVADPAAAEDIFKRCRFEFEKNPTMYTVLDMFGLNVVTANGKTWEKHRRVTVPPFNERVSERVWDESGRQGAGARKKWMEISASGDPRGVRSTQEDTTRVAFNVLSDAGFGMPFDFEDVFSQSGLSDKDRAAGHQMSYRDSIFCVLNDMPSYFVYFLGRMIGWPEFAMWGGVKKFALARAEYAWYMRDMIQNEREVANGGSTGLQKPKKENLMSVLIRNSDQHDENGDKKSAGVKAKPSLSDSEVTGNLYIYNLAGHDTTATTLNFAITLLAVHPQWQEWIAEEIDTVTQEDQSAMKYAQVFPKLHRCLALMYETLRMYPVAPAVPRWTGTGETLSLNGRDISIPPESHIKVDVAGLASDPKFWGPDALEFRPDRWMRSDEKEGVVKEAAMGNEERTYDWQSSALVSPAPGVFVPWTSGPRVCPGKKFSQVEFTRAIFELFAGGARVRVVEEKGESEEEARARAHTLMNALGITIVLKMVKAEEIGLKWYVKR